MAASARNSPRSKPLPLDLPHNPNETCITPLPALPPVLTSVETSNKLSRMMSSSSATASSTLSSPAGRLASRASVRRHSGADYTEAVEGACSSGEFEELWRKLNGHPGRETGEHGDYSPTFQVLQSLRKARTQDLVARLTRLRLIGQGGYGRVYQGMWQGATVAVKFLVTDSATSLERSLTEAVLSKIFLHPHVVQTFTCTMLTYDELPTGATDSNKELAEHSHSSASSSSDYSSDQSETDELTLPNEDPEEAEAIRMMDRFVSGDGFGAPLPEKRSLGFLTYEQALAQLRVQEGQFVTQIIMEFCDKGSLQTAINRGIFKADAKWGARAAFRALLRTAREVALGMVHIHNGNVVHGDLKPANVLLKSSRVDRRGFQAKVADFGLARVADPNSLLPMGNETGDNDFMGTVTHMPPEALSGNVSKAADVYAFGIMMWEMYVGEHPYSDLPPFAIMVGVQNGSLRPEWPDSAPHRLVRLSCRCWDQDPLARPPMDYVLKKLTQIELQLRHEVKRERVAASRRASMVSDASSANFDIASLQDLAAAEQALADRAAAHSPRTMALSSRTASQSVSSPRPTPLHRLSSSSELPSPLQYRQTSNEYHPTLAGASSPPNPSPLSFHRQNSDCRSRTSFDTAPTPSTRYCPHPVSTHRITNDLLPASPSPLASPVAVADTVPPSPLPGLSSLSPFSAMGQTVFVDDATAYAADGHDLAPSSAPATPPATAPLDLPHLHSQSPSLAFGFPSGAQASPSLHSASKRPSFQDAQLLNQPTLQTPSPKPPSSKFSFKKLFSSSSSHRTPSSNPSFFQKLNICSHPSAESPPDSSAPSASAAFAFHPTAEAHAPVANKSLMRTLMTTFSRNEKHSSSRPFVSLIARTRLDSSLGEDSDALKISSRTCSSVKDQSPFALVQRSSPSDMAGRPIARLSITVPEPAV